MYAPTVRGDSLVGTVDAGMAREDGTRTVSVALADIQQVTVPRSDTGKTLVLVGGVLVVGFLILYGASGCADNAYC
jgi:hypothetical protein